MMRYAGFVRTWTVSTRFPLLSFSLQSVVGLSTGWYVTWAGLDDKLGSEVVKSRSLEKELSMVKDTL